MKTFLFKTCPKSGRIIGINKKNVLLKIFFPLFCIAGLIWFLIRVVPKPSRIYYPCQQLVAPIALSTITYIATLTGIALLPRKTKSLIHNHKYFAGLFCSLVFVICVGLFAGQSTFRIFAQNLGAINHDYVPADAGSSTPIGVAKGIFPGRVVWVRDSTATTWNSEFGEGHWWDDKFTNQEKVDRMMEKDLLALTGASTASESWNKIFTFHNKTHEKGYTGYQKGQKIAVKINCNNAYEGYADVDNQIDASKQTVLGMLRQLVNNAGVDQKDILVYEAIRVIPDRIYKPCHKEFPDVQWMDSKGNGENGRLPVQWRPNTIKYSGQTKCGTSIPQLVYDADYIVNMTLMKGHPSVGVSLTAKNHYGTINSQDHPWFKMGEYHPFVDMIASKYLGGKTVLFMLDGLYGIRDVNDPVTREYAGWYKLFGGQWLSSIFMSLDPLAIDAVGYDFLRAEYGARLGRGTGAVADAYMHEAALANNPPSGTIYMQDGKRVQSLGVHEHWNNAKDKQYSRNLDSKNGKGIELFKVK
jgi:hypothetical protein